MFARIIVSVQKKVFGGPHFGTKYDFTNSCSKCGSGAIPIGPRFIELKRVPKEPIFQTLDGEILMTTQLASMFWSLGDGFLAEVRDASSKELLPFWELRAQAELSGFCKSTTGFERERACAHCERDGYFAIPHTPLNLVYQAPSLAFDNLHVLSTYERFGNSRLREPLEKSVFARPLFIVSQEIQSRFLNHRTPGVTFETILWESS